MGHLQLIVFLLVFLFVLLVKFEPLTRHVCQLVLLVLAHILDRCEEQKEGNESIKIESWKLSQLVFFCTVNKIKTHLDHNLEISQVTKSKETKISNNDQTKNNVLLGGWVW